jgi:hypothetical protein
MNNTEKKLDALIDALGLDVEETKTFDSDDVIKWSNRWKTLEGLGVSFVPPDRPTPTVKYKFTKRDAPVEDKPKTHMWMGSHAISMDEYERDYGYMAQIKGLVKESGIPKSVIVDLIEGMPNE